MIEHRHALAEALLPLRPRLRRRIVGHEIGLGQRQDPRQRGQARVVESELAFDRGVVGERIRPVQRGEIEHMNEHARALDVGEEVMAKARPRRSPPRSGRGCRRSRAGGRRRAACRAPARAS